MSGSSCTGTLNAIVNYWRSTWSMACPSRHLPRNTACRSEAYSTPSIGAKKYCSDTYNACHWVVTQSFSPKGSPEMVSLFLLPKNCEYIAWKMPLPFVVKALFYCDNLHRRWQKYKSERMVWILPKVAFAISTIWDCVSQRWSCYSHYLGGYSHGSVNGNNMPVHG